MRWGHVEVVDAVHHANRLTPGGHTRLNARLGYWVLTLKCGHVVERRGRAGRSPHPATVRCDICG